MSTMRWADSDSSDDEEAYVPPTSSAEVPPQKQGNRVEHNKDAVQSPASHPPKATLQSLAAGGRGHPNSNQSRSNRNSPHHHHHQNQHLHQNQNQHSHSHSHPHGGRGRGGRSSGGRSGRGSDWRQMAKEQSQLNSKDKNSSKTEPIDGSAWMAQRRAKMQEEQNENARRIEKQKQAEMEDKRQKRKEQLGALKKAMVEIKLTEPPPSPPRDISRKAKTQAGGSPLTILKKPPQMNPTHPPSKESQSETKDDGAVSKKKQTKKVQKFNVTIGQDDHKPRGELQSNGTVKFSRGAARSSTETNDRKVDDSSQTLDEHERDDEERLNNPKGSKNSKDSQFARKGSGQKKEDFEHSHKGSGRGGTRGRGRGRGRGGGRGRDNHKTDSNSTDRSREETPGGRWNRGGGGTGRGTQRGRMKNDRHHGLSAKKSNHQSNHHSYEIGKADN